MKKVRQRFLSQWVFFLLILLPPVLFALDPSKALHSYKIDSWDMNRGLPQNSVLCLAQTRDGYLWAGTESGLCRFDGVKFTVYHTGNREELKVNRITVMLPDKSGGLWLGTRGGGLYRFKDDKFTHFSTQQGLPDDFVLSLYQDRRGGLWVGTFKGMAVRSGDDRFVPFKPLEKQLSGKVVLAICEDPSGVVWVGTHRGGLIRYDNGAVTLYGTQNGFPADSIRAMLVEKNGNFWVGTGGGGLVRFQGEAYRVYTVENGLAGPFVFSLREDRRGNIWVGTASGLSRFYGETFVSLTTGGGLPDNVIRSLYEDREGSLWLGANTGGLVQLQDGKFSNLTSKDGLSSNSVSCIYEDGEKRLWIGTDGGGLNMYHNERRTHYSTGNGLSGDQVYSVCEDGEGNIWVGTGSGLTVLEANGSTRVYGTGDGLSHGVINVLHRGRDGSIWIGTNGGGLNRFKKGRFYRYTTRDVLSNDFVHCIYEDKGAILWVGTYGGGLNAVHLPPEPDNAERGPGPVMDGLPLPRASVFNTKNGLSDNYVFSILEDGGGHIWVGTGGGLNRVKQGQIASQLVGGGYLDILVNGIFDDALGYCWLSSNKGVFRSSWEQLNGFLDGRIPSPTIDHYDKADGMASSECVGGMQPAGWIDRGGRLWLPTTRGVTSINPSDIKINRQIPPVAIETVVADGRVVPLAGGSRLPAGTKKIEFHYTALSYLAPQKNHFWLKLEGFENNWEYIDEPLERVAYYTNLSPGTYRFCVKGCNNDGVWNEGGTRWEFHLAPYFYQTTWFYVLAAFFLVLLGTGIHRLRIRRLIRTEKVLSRLVAKRTEELLEANEALQKSNELKNEIVNMVAHDLKNPLQAILGYSQMAQMKIEEDSPVKKSINIINDTAAAMRDIIDGLMGSAVMHAGQIRLKKTRIDVGKLATTIVDAQRHSAVNKNQHLILSREEDCFIWGDRGCIRQVIENLVGNAVKFSPRGKRITVKIKRLEQEKRVRLIVRDEGPGFSQEDLKKMYKKFQRLSARPTGGESSTGLGLSIVKRLVLLHKGTINLESAPGQGTSFFVEFPFEM